VVEDDEASAALLRESLGFAVEHVARAEPALPKLREKPFALVLTDVRMPGIDGLTLCQKVVGAHPDVPVVVVTGFGSLQTAVAAIRAGAYDCITKPSDLDAATHRKLERHGGVPEELAARSGATG
jgi:two-component system, NtrC family, response regulator AtoC